MLIRRWLVSLTTAMVLVIIGACAPENALTGPDLGSGPVGVAPGRADLDSGGHPAEATALGGVMRLSSVLDSGQPFIPPLCHQEQTGCSQEELDEWVKAEKDRLKAAKKANKITGDSLKKLWVAFKKTYPKNDTPFFFCEPQKYKSSVKIIGPRGGTIRVGHHKLYIPPGALTQETVITAERPISVLVDVRLTPAGLQFVNSATLTLNYKHCREPVDFEFRIAYIDEHLSILEWPVSQDNKKRGEVSAYIDHFSKYAVAY